MRGFINPPSEIKNRLHSIVDELIRKHRGGREFLMLWMML